ncbi:hypothetical protein C0581_00010 [Candidatus Parcubacteria bacterium]|nr:MAG: hypothetical protein C0581_00010 [Candidatus Parcubacteria bacterium]
MDKRRIIYMVLFILVCILLGFAIYRVFFYKPPTIPISGPGTGQSGEFPSVGEGKTPGQIATPPGTLPPSGERPTTPGGIPTGPAGTPDEDTLIPTGTELVKRITDVTVANLSGDADGGARFYNSQDGKFYRINANGKVELMNDKVFFGVDNVTWSPENNESIIEYPDGANTYFNFDTNEQVTLPTHWEEFTFSNEGQQIAAKSMGLDPENRWIITSDPRGNNIKLIEPMGENASKVNVDWSPTRQVVALSATGKSLGSDRQEILLVGLNHENYKSLTVEGRGMQSQWSPEGSKLLHSVYNGRNDYKPELWIVDSTPDTVGQNRKPLSVNTWADKCTMTSERFVYCGVPDTLETGAGFAPQLADNTRDDLFKIDTVTGIKTKIALDDYYTIESIHTSEDGDMLYFTDKNKTGVFQIPIK